MAGASRSQVILIPREQDAPATLVVRAGLASNAEILTVRELALRSPFLDADVTGEITDLLNTAHAKFEGTLTPDLEKISAFAPQELKDKGFAMTGREARPARFESDLADGIWGLRLRGKAEFNLFIESLALLDVKASPEEARLTLQNGNFAVTRYAPKIGTGQAELYPEILLASDPFEIYIGGQRRPHLDAVPITSALADTLLVYVNPAFKGSVAEGLLTLRQDTTSIPLDDTWKDASFECNVLLEQVQIKPGALLVEMLQAIDLAPQTPVTLNRYESDIHCNDGKISTKPMTLMVKDMPVEFKGTTTLGGNVNFVATLTLTESIAGSAAWPHVKGAKLAVPITGTVAKPVMNAEKLREDFQALLKAAAAERETELLKVILDGLREENE